MNASPRTDITIIIPSRDRLWSLPRAIESCRSKSLAVQIIVIDDGSTDGTADWLRSQPDLVVLQGEGWGKPWGVNRALQIATGKYLRFLDSDDWLKDQANESQFEVAERESADLVVAGLDVYNDVGFVERVEWVDTDDLVAQQLGEGMGSHYSAFLFRRQFVGDIPHRTLFPASNFASRDDRCFMLEVAIRRPRLAVSREPSLAHRHHNKPRLQFQRGLRSVGTNIQAIYIYKQIIGLLGAHGELTIRRKRAAINVLWPLAHWTAYTNPREGREIADWIYDLDPEFVPPETGALGFLYRNLGFRATEHILKLRRMLLSAPRFALTRREIILHLESSSAAKRRSKCEL